MRKRIRIACERFSVTDDAKPYDYYEDPELAGMCATASFALKEYLNSKGIDAKVISGDYCSKPRGGWYGRECHCWVVLNDRLIIDLTATQFGGEKVVITCSHDRYYALRYPKSTRSLRRWFSSQQPRKKAIRKIIALVEEL